MCRLALELECRLLNSRHFAESEAEVGTITNVHAAAYERRSKCKLKWSRRVRT